MQTHAYLLGKPSSSASFRCRPEDFVVNEVLGFEPDGEGEHLFLQVAKTNANTVFVARRIADTCGVHERDVSYSGLKDRHAVTTQWFSVYLPGKSDPALQSLDSDEIHVLRSERHSRKLRRGTHTGNDFVITLRDVEGDRADLEARLQTVGQNGFPNYFGEQRFGFGGQNIDRARQLFSRTGKQRKRDRKLGIYLSAARSWLFNCVLSARIMQGRYQAISSGDVMMLNGAHSVFTVDGVDDVLKTRLQECDVHLTGPLWGGGRYLTSDAQHQWELSCIADDQLLCDGLEKHKLKHERRALRALARNFEWQWQTDATLVTRFHLASGSFATSLLRELMMLNTNEHTQKNLTETK